MNKIKKLSSWVVTFSMLITGYQVKSQDMIPHHIETASATIGPLNGVALKSIQSLSSDPNYVAQIDPSQFTVASQILSVSGQANWFQIKFDEINLGENSYMTITSLLDGGMQKLDARSIVKWHNASAIFNGTQVEVKLYVAPGESNIGLNVAQYVIGDVIAGSPETQCGPTDNRVANSDGAIGRMMPLGCTGWLIPNGNYLSAGHCCDVSSASLSIIEFNVPASTSNGNTVAANPNDQYPIDYASRVFQNVQIGDDYCVFEVGPNSTTGKIPVEKNGQIDVLDFDFYRVTKDNLPSTGRITGYGTDDVPVGSGGGRNSSSQTEQTSTGPFVSETVTSANTVSLQYTIDTEGGNSGSPVIINGTKNASGIHTNGGCNTSGTPGSNSGTSFEADDTETSIVNSTPSTFKYVDENHPTAFAATGTVFRPYKTVNAAITAVAAGTTLGIAEGSYTETIITSKNLTITAPVGLVIIGPSAPPIAPPTGNGALTMKSSTNLIKDDGVKISPNPVVNSCFIDITLENNESLQVTLLNSLGQVEKVLLQNAETAKGVKRIEADLTDLRSGIYLLSIKMQDKTITKMLTKM